MAASLHVGIHANRHCRRTASASSKPRRLFHQNVELRFGFGVEEQNARTPASPADSIVQGFANFMPVLADSGKNDALATHPDAMQVMEFSAGHNVKTAAPPGKVIQNGKISVGLYGKTQSVGQRTKTLVEFFVGIIDGSTTV